MLLPGADIKETSVHGFFGEAAGKRGESSCRGTSLSGHLVLSCVIYHGAPLDLVTVLYWPFILGESKLHLSGVAHIRGVII
jgi:hypothetical protein